jgi:hypothetical protein
VNGVKPNAALNFLLNFSDVDGNFDIEDTDQSSIRIEDRYIGCAELFALKVKRVVADRQDVDDFRRANDGFGEGLLDRNGPRFVYGYDHMMKRDWCSTRAAAQRIIDIHFCGT